MSQILHAGDSIQNVATRVGWNDSFDSVEGMIACQERGGCTHIFNQRSTLHWGAFDALPKGVFEIRNTRISALFLFRSITAFSMHLGQITGPGV